MSSVRSGGWFASGHAGRRTQIGGLTRIGRKSHDRTKLPGSHSKFMSFALESYAHQVDCTVQIYDAGGDYEVIEERVMHIEMVLRLQVARAVAVVELNTRLQRGIIKPFATTYVGDQLLKGCDDANR